MRRCLLGLLAVLLVPGGAQGGGTLRGFVLEPGARRLEIVDVDAGRAIGRLAVPRDSDLVACSIDGSRVLVATSSGGVVEVDGLARRRLFTFRGLGHLVALRLVPRPTFGLVEPRYAVVVDRSGWRTVIDLTRSRVVRHQAGRAPPNPSGGAVRIGGWLATVHGRRLELTAPGMQRTIRLGAPGTAVCFAVV
jgi:hypothetical protein